MRVALRGFVERQAELFGQRCQPGEDVAEFVELLRTRTFAGRFGQLTQFFGQPGHRCVTTSRPIPRPVRPGHQLLELVDQQEPTRRIWGAEADRLFRMSTALTHHRTSPGVSNGPSAPR